MKQAINYYFLGLATLLTLLGLLFLSTLSAIASLQIFGNTNYYLFHQLFSIIIGLVLGTIIFKTPLHFLKKISPFLLLINLLALAIVFLPILGTKFWGASRWISIGNYTFQPSEFFKITAIVYLAAWLSNKHSEHPKKNWVGLAKNGYNDFIKIYIPFLIFLGVIVVMFILQRDISTLGIITIALLAIYFTAQTPLWHTLVSIGIGIGGFLALIKLPAVQ